MVLYLMVYWMQLIQDMVSHVIVQSSFVFGGSWFDRGGVWCGVHDSPKWGEVVMSA